MPTATADLVTTLTRFVRALRERGVPATPSESVDAARTLELVDLGDRHELYLALRVVLTTRPEDFQAFDELFEIHWAPMSGDARHSARVGSRDQQPTSAERRVPQLRSAERRVPSIATWLSQRDEAAADESAGFPLPSARESAGAQDFRAFTDDQLLELARVARRMARRLARRPSRRWRPTERGTRVHMRRTVRRALETGGDLSRLAFRERAMRKTKLVVLCDVSGSMDLYARFLLQFLYALQHSFARVETFVFATRLSRITEQLGRRDWRGALGDLARDVSDWSGGTRIGESLARFVAEWPRLVDSRTIVIVLSDGWDTGDPEVLGEAMAALHRRAGRVIWLNPLLGSAGYQPLTRGMQAALPHVDVFASAHNLPSLEALVRHLSL